MENEYSVSVIKEIVTSESTKKYTNTRMAAHKRMLILLLFDIHFSYRKLSWLNIYSFYS